MTDFAEHNRALLTAIAELEYEAEQRLAVMENRLHEERARVNEDVQAQRINRLESDLRTLARLIRRAQVEGRWRTDGLQLQDTQYNDVLQMAPSDMNVKLCIRMPNNECEERTISIPLSKLPIGEPVRGKKKATAVVVAQKANHQSKGGGQQRGRQMEAENNATRTSVPVKKNSNPNPNSNQRQYLRFQNVNVIRRSVVEEEEEEEEEQQRVTNYHNHQQQEMRRLPQRENLDRPNLFYQQHAAFNGRQQSFGQSRGHGEELSREDRFEQQNEENLNWRRSCERLKRENHDLNKVG